MGTVLPVDKISESAYVDLYKKLKSDAIKLAAKVITGKELGVRILEPTDLGLTTDYWTFDLSAGENSGKVNVELKDDSFIMIFGVYNLSDNPVTTKITFRSPQEIIDQFFIEEMYLYDHPMVIFDNVVAYNPGSKAIIDITAKAANTDERLAFIGFVVKPKGSLPEVAHK